MPFMESSFYASLCRIADRHALSGKSASDLIFLQTLIMFCINNDYQERRRIKLIYKSKNEF